MVSDKFEDRMTDMLAYLKDHTGGSIRHKNISAIECQRALFDLNRDWEDYVEKLQEKHQKFKHEANRKNTLLTFQNQKLRDELYK